VKDAGRNAEEMAAKGAQFLKHEGRKDMNRAKSFIKENPLKGAAYAVGLGALLTYFLIPRK
jgi:hypothetical protein